MRAAMEHGLLHNQTQRLWYQGRCFRHERPQKGRYRQFQQIGVETFGMPGPDIDAELILITARIWQALGIPGLQLQPTPWARHRSALLTAMNWAYFEAHAEVLDEDSQRRLRSNPLRILDSKNPAMREMLDAAPVLTAILVMNRVRT